MPDLLLRSSLLREKDFERLGIPVARSTMNDLFHRAAEVTRPLWKRLIGLVASSEIVFADETPVRIQASRRRRSAVAGSLAVGTNNGLFVGSAEGGENFCGLQALVSTCESNGVNPWAYLKDVLERIGDHPARKLDDLPCGSRRV